MITKCRAPAVKLKWQAHCELCFWCSAA